ncbi:methyl-CpG-binding domain protein 2 isoform X3 [Triticum aestivum]|uniref:methyl-CpG-binding domain protein 2 isoform X3 n=1 Tax=Triticum aestivum TaxID=4565 RepID=UPI001D02F944|nr:methyl-CpG-binding domain protein 2-like isoform X3 [Triticum aestivum]XP_044402844.1 methyl-CpG-binding domain protein 2-like isoform X3 [Triticum aestivum]
MPPGCGPGRGRAAADGPARGSGRWHAVADGPARGSGRGRAGADGPSRGSGRGRAAADGPARGRGHGRAAADGPTRGRGRGRAAAADGPSRGRGRGRAAVGGPAHGRGRGRSRVGGTLPSPPRIHLAPPVIRPRYVPRAPPGLENRKRKRDGWLPYVSEVEATLNRRKRKAIRKLRHSGFEDHIVMGPLPKDWRGFDHAFVESLKASYADVSYLGTPDYICGYCGAYFWYEERVQGKPSYTKLLLYC